MKEVDAPDAVLAVADAIQIYSLPLISLADKLGPKQHSHVLLLLPELSDASELYSIFLHIFALGSPCMYHLKASVALPNVSDASLE